MAGYEGERYTANGRLKERLMDNTQQRGLNRESYRDFSGKGKTPTRGRPFFDLKRKKEEDKILKRSRANSARPKRRKAA